MDNVCFLITSATARKINVLGRSFVKQFALCYRTVALSDLPVCDVGVLWPNGWMDQDETWHGGRPRPRRHCVRWKLSCHPPKGAQSPPQFSAHVYCGQTDRWIKMPLGTEEGLGPCHILWDGDPVPPQRGTALQFSARVYCGQTVAHLVYCWALVEW